MRTLLRNHRLRSSFAALILFAPLVITSCGDSECISGPLCEEGTPSVVVATVEITSSTTSLTSLGATVQLQPTAKNSSGSTVPGKTFTWSSSDVSVATVSTGGQNGYIIECPTCGQ